MKKNFIVCAASMLLLAACMQTREEAFAEAARQLTSQCPMAIDSNTQLDSLVYNQPAHSCTYYYALHGFSDNECAALITYPSFIKNVVEYVKNSVEMKPYKDAGITFFYIYRSKATGAQLGSIKVAPEEYRQE